MFYEHVFPLKSNTALSHSQISCISPSLPSFPTSHIPLVSPTQHQSGPPTSRGNSTYVDETPQTSVSSLQPISNSYHSPSFSSLVILVNYLSPIFPVILISNTINTHQMITHAKVGIYRLKAYTVTF